MRQAMVGSEMAFLWLQLGLHQEELLVNNDCYGSH